MSTSRNAARRARTIWLFAALSSCLFSSACADRDPPYDDPPLHLDASLLSSRGLYRDLANGDPAEAAIEYTPDYALWSDGVAKRRWLLLPPGSQIDTSDMDHWTFPVGTVAVKEFSLDGQRLETRFIERVGESGEQKDDYFLGTFVWREDQSEAVLTADGAPNVNGTSHDVPAQKLCIHCHRGEPGAVLGISAIQASTSGLLARLEELGMLTNAPGRAFVVGGDDTQAKALGVLHANCGHCHSETGLAPNMTLRIMAGEADLPFEETALYRATIGQPVSSDWLSPPPEYSIRIEPGHPESSALLYRMTQRGREDELVPEQMPPIATNKVDMDGVAAVSQWIAALPAIK